MQTTEDTLKFSRYSLIKARSFLIVSDLLLYVSSFTIVLFFRRDYFNSNYFESAIFLELIIAWSLSSLITRKLIKLSRQTFIENVRTFSLAFFILLGGLSFIINIFTATIISRFNLASSLLLGFSLEIVMLWFLSPSKELEGKSVRFIKSLSFFFLDIALLSSILLFFILTYKNFPFLLDRNIILSIICFYFTWFISSVITHQFNFKLEINYWSFFGNILKSNFIFVCLVFFLIFILRIREGFETNLILIVLVYSGSSLVVFSELFFIRIPKKFEDGRLKFLKSSKASDEVVDLNKISNENLYEPEYSEVYEKSFREKLMDIYLKNFPELFSFIDHKINLNKVSLKYSMVLRSNDLYNVEVLPDVCLEIFINLQELNNIRQINPYLIEVNKKLKTDGIFIGRFEPAKYRYDKFLKKYPFYFAQLFYMLDFIWRRVFPKLPVLQRVYFALASVRNGALSMAEVFGRLYYCGFSLINVFEQESYVYFIMKKKNSPSNDSVPSYGPLFKMKRTGKNGKEIYVYKIRTMHPFSEYLQKFVYDINKLEIGGKLKNDFRITAWGTILRKFWIDELPNLVNWFKMDLKLVGVRPLSSHYLNLYPEDLRNRRIKYKPGLIPPFYADLPKTFEEILDSEIRYLDEYDKHPFLTDLKYFYLVWHNIIIKNARSR